MNLLLRRVLSSAAAMPLISMASFASGPVDVIAQPASMVRVAQLRLHFITPSQCLALLAQPTNLGTGSGTTPLPTGIDHVDTDDISGIITLSGSPAGIAKFAEFIAFFDVPHRRVELDVRFVRYSADVMTTPEVVGTGKAIVDSNDTADITTIADHRLLNARLTPHINGDGSTSLKLSLTSRGIETDSDGTTRMSAAQVECSGYTRILTSGAPEATLQPWDPFAKIIPWAKSPGTTLSRYTYYIDVNPTILDVAAKTPKK